MSVFLALKKHKEKRAEKKAAQSRNSRNASNTVAPAAPSLRKEGSFELSEDFQKSQDLRLSSVPSPQLTGTIPENCFKQTLIRERYEGNVVQIGVAVLIFANFIVSAVQVQILPEEGSTSEFVFIFFEWFFGIIFTIELIWNMYGSWWSHFWKSGWNWFDFIIVLISLLALGMSDLPGISVLRLFRAFRVFRLFKRVPSLKLIIEGVVAALPGVFNAFVVVLLLMGIWSIMGVEFFGDAEPQFFGDFFKAMFTMWQVMTFDSWASGIARNLIFDEEMPMAALYFVSFTFICGIIMTNVVVAILLEKYLDATSNAQDEAADELDVETLLDPADLSPTANGPNPEKKQMGSKRKSKRDSKHGNLDISVRQDMKQAAISAQNDANYERMIDRMDGISALLERVMESQRRLEERTAAVESKSLGKPVTGRKPEDQDTCDQMIASFDL